MKLARKLEKKIHRSIANNPVTAILGARQTGKTTLAKQIIKNYDNVLYLDLEKPSDRNILTDAESFFRINKTKLICLDEIQLQPNLFPVLRSLIDDDEFTNKFLVTGSASPELLRQSSESLAGRIAFFELPPLLLVEIQETTNIEKYWLRGGFPLSLLASDSEQSYDWRKNFILTFLERDLNNWGFNIPSETLRRLWIMVAHLNGQTLNYSQLSSSMGQSDVTVKKYIDILANTYMLRVLPPFYSNVKKRLIKSPKIYIRDTGILNALLSITDFSELYSHPIYGSSWEALCIENIINTVKNWEPFFYRTSNGTEIDLILIKANKKIAIEFKTSSNPSVTKGFWNALEDLKPNKAFIIAPVKMAYPYKNDAWVYPISDFLQLCNEF